jgi:hypothetical protein
MPGFLTKASSVPSVLRIANFFFFAPIVTASSSRSDHLITRSPDHPIFTYQSALICENLRPIRFVASLLCVFCGSTWEQDDKRIRMS